MNRFILFLLFLLALLCQTVTSFAAPLAPKIKKPAITEIRLAQLELGPIGESAKKNVIATFYWNGAAVLEGRSGVQHLGAFAGKISKTRFQQLAKLLTDAKFFDLQDGYSSNGLIEDDIEAVRYGKRKSISVRKGTGSKPLQKFLIAIKSEVERTNWKFQRKLAPMPKPNRGSASGAPGPMPNLRGVAMAGPISPVQRIGELNEKPLADAVITIQPDGGGKEIIRKRADKEGRFEFVLSPGKYLLVPLSPQASDTAQEEPEVESMTRAAPQAIVIEKGKVTEVVVSYDTGIR